MSINILSGLFFFLVANGVFAAPSIKGFSPLEANGEKYISRVTTGLKQYLSKDELPERFESLGDSLEQLNQSINDIVQYTPDSKLYGSPDHWANFEEISENLAGDCEDYALMKYWALRKAGVPAETMHVLVFYDQIVRIHHAVLVVKKDNKEFILDNRTDKLFELKKMTDILPNMAINENEFYIYGKIKDSSR